MIETKVFGVSINAQCSEIHEAGLRRKAPAVEKMKAAED